MYIKDIWQKDDAKQFCLVLKVSWYNISTRHNNHQIISSIMAPLILTLFVWGSLSRFLKFNHLKESLPSII